jgi:hypothetical protein
MPYFQVDDQFHNSKKVMAIPARFRNRAIGLWARAGSWSARELTNGQVPTEMLRSFDANVIDVVWLCEVGLWYATTAMHSSCKVHDICTASARPKLLDGYVNFHDWEDYNRTADQVKQYRATNRERQRRFRENDRGSGTHGPGSVTPLHNGPGRG